MGNQMSAIWKDSSLGCILQNWKFLGITPWLRSVSVGKKPVHWNKIRKINQESTENLWHSFRCFRQCLQIYTTTYSESWEGNAKQKKNDGGRELLSWHSSWPPGAPVDKWQREKGCQILSWHWCSQFWTSNQEHSVTGRVELWGCQGRLTKGYS